MSSISDNNTYPNFCAQAAEKDDIFATFKQNSIYNDILEHVTYEEGIEYFNQFKNNETIIKNIDKCKINDSVGAPRSYNYNQIGMFSPTTLRYIKILNDLSQLNLNNKHIVEIGAGYGGQYTILKQFYRPTKYTFIDLKEVLSLIKKYINTLQIQDTETEFIDGITLNQIISSDLVISNYAFSECTTDIQNLYINNVLRHAKHGYMIYNNFNGYNHEQFITLMNPIKVRVNKEIPQTHPNNVLLTW
jgi:putative sugar O-methyltransferase